MAKYILKQEAIFALINEANTHSNPVKRAYTRAAAIIEGITGEEVQPVKHGKWIGVDYDTYFECSECKNMTDWQLYKYCPYCGARMDGERRYKNE